MPRSERITRFNVTLSNGNVVPYEGQYDITTGGLLIVTPMIVDENYTTQLIFAHGGWLCVDVRDGDRDED